MAIISLISQKGGVGKSAIARLLAVEYVRAGWTVKIADIDTMQGTSTKWKLRRDAAKLQPEIPVEKFATVDRALRETDKFDLLIIDGPAHAEKGGLAMGKRSTIILMPTCYGLDDLEAQIEAAYELEENGVDPNVSGSFSRARPVAQRGTDCPRISPARPDQRVRTGVGGAAQHPPGP